MAKVTPIKAPASAGGDFEIAPEGVFLARCYKMVDVGTQTETGQFGTKENRKIYLYWELLQTADGDPVTMENGDQPFSIFNSYKLSMHPKANLRKHLDAWRGKKFTEEEAADFDVTKLLDKFCLLQITHSTSKDGQKTYANIDAIMSTKKTAPGVNEISSFNIEAPDMDVFNALPEWLQAKIEDAPEWDDTDNTADAPAAAAVKKEDVQENEIDVADVPF
jgi:hypothetical protein